MFWLIWALLLLLHGGISRWAQTRAANSRALLIRDVLLVTIGLITIDQLQGLDIGQVVRTGCFFVAFGTSGRHLVGSALRNTP